MGPRSEGKFSETFTSQSVRDDILEVPESVEASIVQSEADVSRESDDDQSPPLAMEGRTVRQTGPPNDEQVGDEAEILRALAIFATPGQIVELRAFEKQPGKNGKKPVLSRCYDDLEALARDAASLDAESIYFTLNPLKASLSERVTNTLGRSTEATEDEDIEQRHWLLTDFDTNPHTCPSTDEEKAHTVEAARRFCAWLLGEFGVRVILADSGNGTAVLLPVALPNDEASKALVERFLRAVAHLYNNENVTVDTGVANASRIWKLPGTLARKGEGTPDRRHRMARILGPVPEDLTPVPRDVLEQVIKKASMLPAPTPNGDGPLKDLSGKKQERARIAGGVDDGERNVDATKYIGSLLGKYPEDEWESFVWTTVRAWNRQNMPPLDETELRTTFDSIAGREREKRGHLKTQKPIIKEAGRSVMEKRFEPLNWIVTHVLPEGFTLMGGKAKSGKTLFQDKLALAVGAGKAFWTDVPESGRIGGLVQLREFTTKQRPVLFVSLEDGERRTQRRLKDLLLAHPEYEPGLDNIEFVFDCPLAEDGGIELIRQWLEEHPNGLVLIDHYWRFLKGTDSGGNIAQKDYLAMMRLHDLVKDRPGSALLLSIHLNKAAGKAINKGEDIFDHFQGTIGNAAAPDLMLALVRYGKGNVDSRGTLYARGRDLAEGDTVYLLKIADGGSWEIRAKDEVDPAVEGAILTVLAEATEMLSPKAIFERWGQKRAALTKLGQEPGPAMSQTAVTEALRDLAGEGKLTRTGVKKSLRYGLPEWAKKDASGLAAAD